MDLESGLYAGHELTIQTPSVVREFPLVLPPIQTDRFSPVSARTVTLFQPRYFEFAFRALMCVFK